ncbi:cupredoxin domain-containing protein [Haloplanus aerogenes]|uniref:Uncharacterized protein n=1 Tax=Haloplanus aerogenes TaxID=660522 RepID=A0A3M0CX09_9EURY|nr:hypothetical protein [Haloplanus aerogenes]AZH27065.1 hypothetical protein DU502_17545 [Haloplanus aerogenes]RMB13437.1 hypothetical protein ATH50_2770 [Haloplanus aerogenes]
MTTLRRREFLLAAGGALTSLAGCTAPNFPGGRRSNADATLYVGAYHWGFVVLDESGTERERVVFDPGSVVDVVAFNTSAEAALETLPSAVRGAVPDHEALEERNEERMPSPPGDDFHEALEHANEQYPDHSLAVMPSGQHMGGGMGGMMLHPIPLPADATSPTTARLTATQRGDYTLSCLTYCGYGHPYMERVGVLGVR